MMTAAEVEDHRTVSSLLTAWASSKWLILLTVAMVPITFLDFAATFYNIQTYGIAWEVNPIFRWFYQNNLMLVWFAISVASSTLTFAIVGSIYGSADGGNQSLLATVYSAMWTIRLTASLYGAGASFMFLEDPRFLILVAVPVFLGVRLLLRYEAQLTWAGLLSWLRRLRGDVFDSLIRSRMADTAPRATPLPAIKLNAAPAPPTLPKNSKRRLMKVLVAVILLVLIPVVIVPAIQQLLLAVMMANIPYDWFRDIGIVSQVQGQVFLANLALIVVVIASMVYLILVIFNNLQAPSLQ